MQAGDAKTIADAQVYFVFRVVRVFRGSSPFEVSGFSPHPLAAPLRSLMLSLRASQLAPLTISLVGVSQPLEN